MGSLSCLLNLFRFVWETVEGPRLTPRGHKMAVGENRNDEKGILSVYMQKMGSWVIGASFLLFSFFFFFSPLIIIVFSVPLSLSLIVEPMSVCW